MNSRRPLLEADTTYAVVAAFRTVHRTLGFGYREYIYSLAMERELKRMGHRVDRECKAMVYYRGQPLADQSMDMVVNDTVIVENKTGERLPSYTPSQLYSYLSATHFEVGMILHFGPQPKFFRVICENRFKRRLPPLGPSGSLPEP